MVLSFFAFSSQAQSVAGRYIHKTGISSWEFIKTNIDQEYEYKG